MKAVWFERKGPARDVLVHGEMPAPEPGAGEVRVRLRVSGVNPTDTKTRGGWLGMTGDAVPADDHRPGRRRRDRPRGPGRARRRARASACGSTRRISGRAFGTLAEFVVVPARNAVRLPDGIDDDTGAGLGVPALTAHRCLFIDGPIHGRTVLVQGGGGGVGHAAIQLARWAGAHVIATVSREAQQEAALAAGAHLVVNRKTQKVVEEVRKATGGRGVDRIVEVAFDENIQADADMLAVGGAIATYSAGPGAAAADPVLHADAELAHRPLRAGLHDGRPRARRRHPRRDRVSRGWRVSHARGRALPARARPPTRTRRRIRAAVVGKILVDLPS